MKSLFDFRSRFRILKGGKIGLLVSAIIGSTTITLAAPTGGIVTSGSATISTNGNVTNITQSTNKASINWQNFSISSNETVNFNQPNSSSITLNRVVGNETSVINGALNANGQVWILNSNGVLFGKNASINTSGILATTKNLSDANFQSGNYTFTGDSNESVINQGTINIQNNGYVVFASNETKNTGTIKVVRGSVHLVGAEEYTINLNGNSLVNLTVNKGVLDALVENSGTIIADGGEIYLTTNAVDELLKGVVNNTGILEANSIDDLTGTIELYAHGGEVQVGGTLEASNGFIETSGKDFTILDDTSISAGEWLIDPVNLVVSDATAYETALNNGTNTTIQTDNSTGTDEGNIYIEDAIDWTTTAKLTLDAYNDIYIDADITATQGSLALYYGQGAVNSGNTSSYYFNNATINLSAGNNFFTKLGNDVSETTWTVITSLGAEGSTTGTDLQGINGNLSGNYVLGADIDGSITSTWNSGEGWDGIGDGSSSYFSGNFDGLGHTISNITMNRSVTTQYYFGLFDYIKNATIKNLTLDSFNIVAQNSNGGSTSATGALGGYIYSSIIDNVYVTNSVVDGRRGVGGLAGQVYNTEISNSSVVNGSVTGTVYNIGGLVGFLSGTSIIKDSYADTTVTGGSQNTGGLVGFALSTSSIENSYAKGTVTGDYYVGGLVGNINDSTVTITNSYASNTVSGTANLGGLYGDNSVGATIVESYYDSDVNTDSMMDDSSLGLSESDILALITNGTWDNTIWATQDSDYNGYAVGTSISLPELQSFYTGSTLFLYGYGTASNPYTISNWTQLQNINYNSDTLNGGYYYTLINDLTTSMSDYTSIASSSANSGTGWYTIGNANNLGFTGSFDGQEYTIDGLYINSSQNGVGLFGYTSNATIDNVSLTNVDITGGTYTGALVGYNSNTVITNSYSTGVLTSTGQNFGGLVGINIGSGAEINYSYSSVDVTGSGSNNRTGGLVGWNYNGASVKNSYATGSVSAGDGVGGLVGSNENGSTVENSYSTGAISSTASWHGGLIGWNNATITNSYWDIETSGETTSNGGTGLTTAQMSYGGLFDTAGWDIVVDSSINSSTPVLKYDSVNDKYVWAISPLALIYNLGSESTTYDGTAQSLSDFYTSSTSIFGSDYDFLGLTSSDYSFQVDGSNVTDYTKAGTYSNIKLVLNTTDEFLTIATAGNTDGTLTINKASATVTAGSATTTYNGTVQSVSSFTVSGLVGSDTTSDLDGVSVSGTGINAGIYTTTASGTDENYDLTFVDGTLTINKANATVTANSDTTTYDGTSQSVSGFTVTGLVNGETASVLDGVSATGASGTNAGTYTNTASGTDDNYSLTFVDGTLTINKANATVTADSKTVTYDGSLKSVSSFTVTGLVNGESTSVLDGVSVSGSGTEAGTYPTTASGVDENYNLTFVDGTLTISPTTETITKVDEPSNPTGGEGEKLIDTTNLTNLPDTGGDSTETDNQDNSTETTNNKQNSSSTTESKNSNENSSGTTESNNSKESTSDTTESNDSNENSSNTTESNNSNENSSDTTESNDSNENSSNATESNNSNENSSDATESNNSNENSNDSDSNSNATDSKDSNSNTSDSSDTNDENSMSKDEDKVVAQSEDTLEKNTDDDIQLNDAQIEMTVDENGNVVYSKSQIEVKVKNDGQLVFGDNSSDVLETMGLAIKDISVKANQIEIIILDEKNNNNSVKYSATLANGDSLPANLVINRKTGRITGSLPKETQEVEIFIKATSGDNTVRIVGLKIKLTKFANNEG